MLNAVWYLDVAASSLSLSLDGWLEVKPHPGHFSIFGSALGGGQTPSWQLDSAEAAQYSLRINV